jgi:hypothetical protein
VDLYFIAKSGLPMADALQYYRQKFAGLNVNVIHVIKSLVYFADAEKDPMPVMLVKWSWDEVKRFFQREAKALFETL